MSKEKMLTQIEEMKEVISKLTQSNEFLRKENHHLLESFREVVEINANLQVKAMRQK